MSNKTLLLVVAMFVLLLCGTGFAAYILVYKANNKQQPDTSIQARAIENTKTINKALDELRTDGPSTTTVLKIEKVLTDATNPNQEAYTKIALGGAYVTTDPKKAISIFKEVSLNESYNLKYRALAAYLALEIYMGGKDIALAKDSLFTGPVWGDFLKNTNLDAQGLDLGVMRGLQWSVSLAPSFTAEYALAFYHAEQIGTNKKSEYITLTKQDLIAGDNLYAAALAENKTAKEKGQHEPYSQNRLGIALEHKILANTILYELGASDQTLDEVSSDFKNCIHLLESDPSQRGALISALFTRFHYAVLLMHADSATYNAQIVTILSPLFKPDLQDTNFYRGYLKSYGTDPHLSGSVIRKDMLSLAKINTDFKNLLITFGWSPKAFN